MAKEIDSQPKLDRKDRISILMRLTNRTKKEAEFLIDKVDEMKAPDLEPTKPLINEDFTHDGSNIERSSTE